MSIVALIVDFPTVVVTVAEAAPGTGFEHVSVLPPQNPLPGPVSPRVPKAVSSEMTTTVPGVPPKGLGPKL
jgi:hypothetical protein